jgi:type II secretory pathway predicted ATPase ExeA
MSLAGARHPLFTDNAMEALAVSTKGYPRLVNKFAVRALLHGFQRKAEQVDAELIRIAAQEFGP